MHFIKHLAEIIETHRFPVVFLMRIMDILENDWHFFLTHHIIAMLHGKHIHIQWIALKNALVRSPTDHNIAIQ